MVTDKELADIKAFLINSNEVVKEVAGRSSNIEMKFEHKTDTLRINFSIERLEDHTGGLL